MPNAKGAACALENACRDFELPKREKDVIAKHLSPLNLRPPRNRRSALVCAPEKVCAVLETFGSGRPRRRAGPHSIVRPAGKEKTEIDGRSPTSGPSVISFRFR